MKSCDGRTDYRSSVSQIFAGLLDKSVYDKWQDEGNEMYTELNNLIYEIGHQGEDWPLFETLARDLWACDYVAEENPKFNRETVEEQLKIINLCLRGQYLEIED